MPHVISFLNCCYIFSTYFRGSIRISTISCFSLLSKTVGAAFRFFLATVTGSRWYAIWERTSTANIRISSEFTVTWSSIMRYYSVANHQFYTKLHTHTMIGMRSSVSIYLPESRFGWYRYITISTFAGSVPEKPFSTGLDIWWNLDR